MNHFGTYVRTYARTYVQVIFEGSYPALKLTKQKMSEIIQVNVPKGLEILIAVVFCKECVLPVQ